MNPEERLKGLVTFVQAAEAGSFALAAERLRQTRSAVGKSIARLEQRVGTRLFHRTTRQQSLTESGQLFFERCKRALAEIDAAEAALDENRRELVGRLRISVPVVLGRVVAPLLAPLLHEHARLDLELSFSDRVVDLLDEGFDLGVRVGPLADSGTLVARRLGRFDLVICASPGYLAAHGEPATADAFADHLGIVYASAGPEAPWRVRDGAGREHELRVQRRLRLDDVQAMADAALAGIGLVRLPRWLAAPHLRSGALKPLWPGSSMARNEVHAVWPGSRQLPLKTRVAVDLLAAQLPAALAAAPGVDAVAG